MDWAYGPLTPSEDANISHIRGQSTKVEVEMALQKEMKVVYDKPKPVRGEKLPRNIYPRWFETFLTSWILF